MSKQKKNLPQAFLPKLPDNFMKFDLAKQVPWLDTLLRQRGTPILLTPHVICPCISPTRQGGSGEAVPDCPSCSGTGFAYPGDPIQIKAPVTGVNANDTHREEGTLSTGQIQVVVPSDITIAEGDRLHLYETLVSVRHVRRYRKSVLGVRLPFDVREVRSLVTNEPTTLEIIELVPGRHYSLDRENNILRFSDSGPVQDSSVVSGVFMVAPYYIIDALSSAFRGQVSSAFSKTGDDEWVKMPQACTATRADILFGRFEKDIANRGSVDSEVGS